MTGRRHLVVGTAGHIDHGKSALVKALTGTDPDRLKEEKRRGITLDLGFADLELPGGRTLSFVDVPGHERFVRHMVAGAAGVDAVLLVVAADQGVQPQSREHLAICNLLGIRAGIVALTKADLVEPDVLAVARLEVAEWLEGSFLASAPVLEVSAKTGRGLDALRHALADLFDAVPERPVTGVARLPVDRTFVMQGFGTVVTGTLVSGVLEAGQSVEILPGRRRAKIRGLHVHRRSVERAEAGQRVAVNLQGVDREEVPRGVTVTTPGAMETTRRILAAVTWLPAAPASLRRAGGTVRFHQTTLERDARVRVLQTEAGGEEALVEIRLSGEAPLSPEDRFILRRPAPVDTVGGGRVLDIRPPLIRRANRERVLAAARAGDALVSRVLRAGRAGVTADGLARELGATREEIAERLAASEMDEAWVSLGGRVFHRQVLEDLSREAEARLAAFHRSEPLLEGMPREALRSALAPEMPKDAWRAWLEAEARSGRLRLRADVVASADHEVQLSDRDREALEGLEAAILRAGLDPPDPSRLLEGMDPARGRRLLQRLESQGRLVRLGDGRYVHREALEALLEKLHRYAQTSRTIDVAAFKELAGVSRKNAIPLLEHLDAQRRTRRRGNVREILGV